MSDVKARAGTVAMMPHVKAWLKRFHKVAAEMPPEVWVYVASGTPTVMACGADMRPIFQNGKDGANPDAVICLIPRAGGGWDGGDW